jgi:hypothetical protein
MAPTVHRTRPHSPVRQTGEHLAHYTNPKGSRREIITLAGARSSTLLIDRDARTQGDDRVIAHLSADEPPENAAIVCGLYLREQPQRRCRLLRPQDSEIDPGVNDIELEVDSGESQDVVLADSAGNSYSLQRAPDGCSLPQLRWHLHRLGANACAELVTLRKLTGTLECYQPAVGLTKKAVSVHELDETVSVTVLRAELRRLLESPIVLNRGLRKAVLAATEKDGLSMSEIAIRCGRRKRDQRGCESGETSWLARRIGILPEGGQQEPTPWVHSDVLALIARDGLGVAPLEVELN